MVGEDLGEQQVGTWGAGEDAVDGEVADLLEVAEVDGDAERGRCGGEGAVGGEEPPAGDLHPLSCQQQERGEVVGAGALEGYEVGGGRCVGAATGEVGPVGLAE